MRHDEASWTMDRSRHWLAALERELKSRIGWADEAISPFRARKRALKPVPVKAAAPVQAQARRSAIPTGKAAA